MTKREAKEILTNAIMNGDISVNGGLFGRLFN